MQGFLLQSCVDARGGECIPATPLAAAPDPKGDAALPKQRARRAAHPPRRAGVRGLPSCSVEPARGDLLLLFNGNVLGK